MSGIRTQSARDYIFSNGVFCVESSAPSGNGVDALSIKRRCYVMPRNQHNHLKGTSDKDESLARVNRPFGLLENSASHAAVSFVRNQSPGEPRAKLQSPACSPGRT